MKVGSWNNLMMMTDFTSNYLPSSNTGYWTDQDNYILGVTADASKSGLTGSGSGSGSFSLSYFKPGMWIIKA